VIVFFVSESKRLLKKDDKKGKTLTGISEKATQKIVFGFRKAQINNANF
jgi:hypothetical protein